jgi:hypothetical protein
MKLKSKLLPIQNSEDDWSQPYVECNRITFELAWVHLQALPKKVEQATHAAINHNNQKLRSAMPVAMAQDCRIVENFRSHLSVLIISIILFLSFYFCLFHIRSQTTERERERETQSAPTFILSASAQDSWIVFFFNNGLVIIKPISRKQKLSKAPTKYI